MILTIGLDSATWWLIKREKMNSILRLVNKSIWGVMHSTIPAMTIPAWASMVTNMTPSELKLYGFRRKLPHKKYGFTFADSRVLMGRAIWDKIGLHGKKSIVFAVPPTFPPYRINGVMVSGLLTPPNSVYATPMDAQLKLFKIGEYIPDIDPRKSKPEILEEAIEATKVHFEMFRELLELYEWDFAMIVEIALDRVHHVFWRHYDENHWAYTKDELSDAIPKYYKVLDNEIKKTIRLIDLDVEDNYLMFVSDHGIQGSNGGVALNQILEQEGYLKLNNQRKFIELTSDNIDDSSIAWAAGGLAGRVYVSLKNRDPYGVVPPSKYDTIIDELTSLLMDINDGTKWNNSIYTPALDNGLELGHPDIIVYFDDMRRRVFASVGYKTNFPREREKRHDDATHSTDGIVLIHNEFTEHRVVDASIYDFVPTVYKMLGLENEIASLRGESLVQ